MTSPDPHLPEHDSALDPLDELASAHLDGLTTAGDEARIASDAELQARVAAMERVRAALHEPVPLDDGARERGITAALAAFDEGHEAATASDFAAAAARRRSQRRTLRVLSVAAAVVLLIVAVPLLAGLGDDGSDADLAATSDEATDEAQESEAALDASGGQTESTASRSEAADPDAAAGGDDGAGAESGEEAYPTQDDYSAAPAAGAFDADAVRPIGLLDGVEALGERITALVLDALRLLGTTGDP